MQEKSRLGWWAPLLIVGLLVALVAWKYRRHEELEASDVEARLEALRKEACACTDAECRIDVGKRFDDYLKEVEGEEVSEDKLGFLLQLSNATERCLRAKPAKPAETPSDAPPS